MTVKNRRKTISLSSILEAVDTLSHIVDLDFDQNKNSDELNENSSSSQRTITWLRDPNSVSEIKNIFKVVLLYLKNFYKKDRFHLQDSHTIEGVKDVMVLVGEAAKKLDDLFVIFDQGESITSSNEYRELEAFYHKRVSKKIDEAVLSKWILGLTQKTETNFNEKFEKNLESTEKIDHIFMNFEIVKNDSEYELFFIRKEDGSRFFNSKLIKNMKLISDFERHFSEEIFIEESKFNFNDWKDRLAQINAETLLKSLGEKIDQFFKETAKYRKLELAGALNSALLALILSNYKLNRQFNSPIKSCKNYFKDFLYFLNQALQSREYQRFIAYKPNEHDRLANILLEMTHALCEGLFVFLEGYKEILPLFKELFDKEEKYFEYENFDQVVNIPFWKLLTNEFQAITTIMKSYPNGPLLCLLKSLENDECDKFAPLLQENYPARLYTFYYHDQKHINIRLPAPIVQQFINKASIDLSFQGFLRSFEKDSYSSRYLIINLQDRTGWREAPRCQVLETLEKLNSHLQIMTLAFDTEFYHQQPPYDKEYFSDDFIDDFYQHLNENSSGFYFSFELKESLFPNFTKNLLNIVHRVFFSSHKDLNKEERLNFIDICYFFLTLKAIETINPIYFSMVCKDGIDISGSFNLTFYMMMKLINKEPIGKGDLDFIHYFSYSIPLLLRERIIFKERYDRVISLIRLIENMKKEWGENYFLMISESLDPLFNSKLFTGQLISSRT